MKLRPEKKWPVEGEDYGFVDMDGVDKVTSIRILKGKFEGVVYHYGTIEVVEEDPPRIKFDYFLDDGGKFEFKDLQSNKKFDTMMGDILVSIFDNNILKKKELDDEAGTDDTEELNLQ